MPCPGRARVRMWYFIPYRPQIEFERWPVVTLAIVALCLLVYFLQARNEARILHVIDRICQQEPPSERGTFPVGSLCADCREILQLTYLVGIDPEARFRGYREQIAQKAGEALAERYERLYRELRASAPPYYTAWLAHDRTGFDPRRMLTSTIAHGSWEHVIFNLFFFFAFASVVELIVGPLRFLLAYGLLALGIGVFDSLIARWQADPLPSLGLSGVVMGMMTLAGYLAPQVKIRFFLWVLVSIGLVSLPLWFVGLWYVGWDLYYQFRSKWSFINYVAHLSGAAFGLAIGLALFRAQRSRAQAFFAAADPRLERLDSRAAKINIMIVGGGFLGYVFWTAAVPVFLLAVFFVENYGLQFALVAPSLAAGFLLYRLRREERSDWTRYKEAEALIGTMHFEEAVARLKPLAESGYPRAQYALAGLYAAGHGVVRDERQARRWYEAAALRGHTAAQQALAQYLAEGRGGERDLGRAIQWYEKAAHGGLPEAAASLGFLYEHGASSEIVPDKEKAVEWYGRAATAYLRAGRYDDAEALLRHLEALAKDYPAVLGWVAKWRRMLPRARVSGGTHPAARRQEKGGA